MEQLLSGSSGEKFAFWSKFVFYRCISEHLGKLLALNCQSSTGEKISSSIIHPLPVLFPLPLNFLSLELLHYRIFLFILQMERSFGIAAWCAQRLLLLMLLPHCVAQNVSALQSAGRRDAKPGKSVVTLCTFQTYNSQLATSKLLQWRAVSMPGHGSYPGVSFTCIRRHCCRCCCCSAGERRRNRDVFMMPVVQFRI